MPAPRTPLSRLRFRRVAMSALAVTCNILKSVCTHRIEGQGNGPSNNREGAGRVRRNVNQRVPSPEDRHSIIVTQERHQRHEYSRTSNISMPASIEIIFKTDGSVSAKKERRVGTGSTKRINTSSLFSGTRDVAWGITGYRIHTYQPHVCIKAYTK